MLSRVSNFVLLTIVITTSVLSTTAMAIPREPIKCAVVISAATSLDETLSNTVLREEVKGALRSLVSESKAFQDFFTKYMALVKRSEADQQLMDWLAPGYTQLPLDEASFRNQINDLDNKWTERIAVKRKKLMIILEILSHAKITDKFEINSLFTQSMLFQSPGDPSKSSKDKNTGYIVNLLEYCLAQIKMKEYGIEGLLKDPAVIQEMMKVNRKFSTAEFQDGRSGIYSFP